MSSHETLPNLTKHTSIESFKDRRHERPHHLVINTLLGRVGIVDGVICEHFLVFASRLGRIQDLDDSSLVVNFDDLLEGPGFLFVAHRPTSHYHLYALVAYCLIKQRKQSMRSFCYFCCEVKILGRKKSIISDFRNFDCKNHSQSSSPSYPSRDVIFMPLSRLAALSAPVQVFFQDFFCDLEQLNVFLQFSRLLFLFESFENGNFEKLPPLKFEF